MYGSDDGGFYRRESDDCGRAGIRKGWTVNNMLRGDEEPGHFAEDVEPEEPYETGQEIED